MDHVVINPTILYWGTPVVLVSTTNPDGTPNLAPISSAFWLSDRCMLGFFAGSQTPINLLRTKQCVLNLPSDDMVKHVDGLARTTGTPNMPDVKIALGYSYAKDKFSAANLTPQASELVQPPRIYECPVQMEAELVGVHEMHGPGPAQGLFLALEVRILRTYVTPNLRVPGKPNRVNPDVWRPLIMSFQQFYGLREQRPGESRLAEIDEDLYRPAK